MIFLSDCLHLHPLTPSEEKYREDNYKDSDAEFTARVFINFKGKTAEQQYKIQKVQQKRAVQCTRGILPII